MPPLICVQSTLCHWFPPSQATPVPQHYPHRWWRKSRIYPTRQFLTSKQIRWCTLSLRMSRSDLVMKCFFFQNGTINTLKPLVVLQPRNAPGGLSIQENFYFRHYIRFSMFYLLLWWQAPPKLVELNLPYRKCRKRIFRSPLVSHDQELIYEVLKDRWFFLALTEYCSQHQYIRLFFSFS